MPPSDPCAPAATVVLVEADMALLQALRFMFVSEGFVALTCGSGEGLLQLALPTRGLCLVIDERLPGISGLDALAKLRGSGMRAPALLIATNPDAALRQAARRAAAGVVEKPLVGDTLLEAVKSALRADG